MAEEKKVDALGLDAVTAVATALAPLDTAARGRVLSAALALLGMQSQSAPATSVAQQPTLVSPAAAAPAPGLQQIPDIRTFKELKQPRSDVEMVTLVAYYLSELAPEQERKDTITPKDVEKYCKQANYPVPHQASATLYNARNGGYLELVGKAHFKLNAVGHNLIAHNLPRAESSKSSSGHEPKRVAHGATRPARKSMKQAAQH